MRLNVKQMRFIRAAHLKREDWCGKSLMVFHEHLGEVVFSPKPIALKEPSKRRSMVVA